MSQSTHVRAELRSGDCGRKTLTDITLLRSLVSLWSSSNPLGVFRSLPCYNLDSSPERYQSSEAMWSPVSSGVQLQKKKNTPRLKYRYHHCVFDTLHFQALPTFTLFVNPSATVPIVNFGFIIVGMWFSFRSGQNFCPFESCIPYAATFVSNEVSFTFFSEKKSLDLLIF